MKRLLLAFAVSAVACDSLPRSLDEDECRGWAEHYLEARQGLRARARRRLRQGGGRQGHARRAHGQERRGSG
ncbi:MAG: hypothetical protein V9F04_14440, partial [Dermatophilaceae bacterium]